MRAHAELDVEAGQRLRWSSASPVVLRRTGPARVHLVQAAGGPLGGDELELSVRLAAGTELTVASAAATVAQAGWPGGGPARWTVTAEVGVGAGLRWWPEPTVLCDGAELHVSVRLALAAGARALVREEVRLGRHGQLGGRYRGALAVDVGGVPLVRHTTVLDGADPGLTGPAGTTGARSTAAVLGAGLPPYHGPARGEWPGLRWACHDLAGPGWLLIAVGDDQAALSRLVNTAGDARHQNETRRAPVGHTRGLSVSATHHG